MNRRRGFTLVELLVTMTLLSFLVIAGLAAMSTGINSAAKARRYNEMVARGQGALQLISRDIRAALAHDDFYMISLDNQHEGRDADTIDFIVAGMPRLDEENPAIVGRCEVGYYIENDPDTELQWLLRREDSSLDEDELEGGAVSLVGPFVASLDVEFYDGFLWQDGWDEQEEDFPKAVRIEITVLDEDEHENPIILRSTVSIMAQQLEEIAA